MEKKHKYLFVVLLYFFFNSFLLPLGLLYTMILTPLFYWWLYRQGFRQLVTQFIILLAPFAIIHFVQGVNAFYYLKSTAMLFTVYIFGYTVYTFVKDVRLESFFPPILKLNFLLVILAILLFFTPWNKWLWTIRNLTIEIADFPRLELLTYEPSYYSFLLAPIAIYYLLKLMLRPSNSKDWWAFAGLIALPLLLSFSLGILASLCFAFIGFILLNAKSLLPKRKVFYFLASISLLLIIGAILLLVIYPENPLYARIMDIYEGKDISARGRTVNALALSKDIAERGSLWFGVGLGQIKVVGAEIIREFYNYHIDDLASIRIPNTIGETIAMFGFTGLFLRLALQIYLFFKTKVFSNYYRSMVFLFVFIYQFTGSFFTNIVELVMWIIAFTPCCFDFDRKHFVKTRSIKSPSIMKVLMIARSSLWSNPGGDSIQMRSTANALQKLGVAVDIKLDGEQIDYQDYDLIHGFNIIRPAALLKHILKSQLPCLISTIYVDYEESDLQQGSATVRLLHRLLSKEGVEYLKTIARHVNASERFSHQAYWWQGQRKSIQQILQQKPLLLPNSQSEYQRFVNDFPNAGAFEVIPNSIDPDAFPESAMLAEEERAGVICVGRIDRIKNQLNVIKAFQGSTLALTIIGKAADNQGDYYEACRKAAGPNVQFIEHLPQAELAAHYGKAKVHVLASWFETTGLVNLEAAAMGCRIVITAKGDTKAYFGEEATYCDPADINSIRTAIEKAYQQPWNQQLVARIRRENNWDVTAQKTKAAYEKVLKREVKQ